MACSDQDSEALIFAQCGKSADTFNDKEMLDGAIYELSNYAEKNSIENVSYFASYINQLARDKYEPHGSSTNPMYTIKILSTWYESNECQKLKR